MGPFPVFPVLVTLFGFTASTKSLEALTERLLGPILMFVVLYLLGRIVRRLATRAVVKAKGDEQVRALVHNAITVGTLVIAVLSASVVAGLNVNVLLTFGGLTSLAIGLAFQNLLQNILSGMFILMERPFKLGDSITISMSMNPLIGVTGVVQSVTLRTTTLKTDDGKIASVPNLLVFSDLVIINTALDKRRQSFDVRVFSQFEVRPMVEHIKSTLSAIRGIESKPAPVVKAEPSPEGGFLVRCSYWVSSKKSDIDGVVLAVSQALWGEGSSHSPPRDEVVAPS